MGPKLINSEFQTGPIEYGNFVQLVNLTSGYILTAMRESGNYQTKMSDDFAITDANSFFKITKVADTYAGVDTKPNKDWNNNHKGLWTTIRDNFTPK